MNKCPEYKTSAVEWIGDIPEHWEVIKLKYALESLESGSRETGGGSISEGIFSIGGEHIGWLGELLLDNPKYISEDYYNDLKNGKIKANDVLLVKDGATIGKCSIIISLPFEKCAVNEHVFILRVNENFEANYLFYFVWCRIGQEQILLNVRGSAQPGLNSYFKNEVIIPSPSKLEQTAIANYLDEKTVQIDKLITNKQKLTEQLKEERTAIINQAVTRGIDPNVKLKSSGIDWLGHIPEHWEVKRLKYLCKIRTGSKNTENRVIDGEYPFFVRSQEIERINSYTFDGEAVLTAGDGVGVAKVFHHYIGKFDYHQRVYCISEFCEVDGKYIYYYLMVNLIKEILRYNAKSTVDSLRLPMFQNFAIAYSSNANEQKQIVKHIESETKRIDNTTSKIEEEIELLQEYRTALISEVVTGKIKVI